jgi:two-component system sensor histidine kinase HydH
VQLGRNQASVARSGGRIITIEFEPATDHFVLRIDAAQIEDAVLNLIINAIEAIEGQGRVIVRVRTSREPVSPAPNYEHVTVEVADTGRGISAEDLQRIFNPFYTTTNGGTGLGLPAVRRIARAHGGDVEVRSKPGAGSTFTIKLPVSAQLKISCP